MLTRLPNTLERLARDSLTGMTGGLVVVSVYFVLMYAYLSVGCAAGWDAVRVLGVDAVRLVLGILTFAALGLTGFFGWQSLRAARREGGRTPERDEPALLHFTGLTAALICGMALVTAVWVAAPVFFLVPCH